MLCLEAGAWNTRPRLLLGILLSTSPSFPVEPPFSGGYTPHSEVSSLPCPGVSNLLEASLVVTFLLPRPRGTFLLWPWPQPSSCSPATPF